MRFGSHGGSVSSCTLNQIRSGWDLLIIDGCLTTLLGGWGMVVLLSFGEIYGWMIARLKRSYSRLYQLADNKLVTVSKFCQLG